MKNERQAEVLNYMPGVGYFRRALHGSRSKKEAIEWGLILADELEHTRDWLHRNGLPIPKKRVHPDEAKAKGWIPSRRA